MIQANELRVGNYVKICSTEHIIINNAGSIEIVESIDGNGINLEEQYGGITCGYRCENLEGIPFTPEILEKCGFTSGRQTNIDRLIKYDFWQTQNLGGKNHKYILHKDGEYIFYKGYNIVGRAFIKYLHTFQNLYFAVYGNELEYTPCK